MERYQDFTVDQSKWSGFPAYAEQLHAMGMKLVLIKDPAIDASSEAFKRAKQQATF